jgi:hypothetical protein
MATGVRDTSSLVDLAGWDSDELQKFRLEDGTTYDAIVAQVNAAIGALNGEIANDPLWAGLISFTDQPEVEYRVGVSSGFGRHSEYGRPDAQRGETTGHMLPLVSWDRMLGWTWDYLRKARMPQIQADIADAIKDARDLWRKQLLTRLLKRGDDSGASSGLGAAGYSAGFCTAAASTNVDFTPPAFGGTSFDSNHEHYVGIAGGAFTAAVFQDAKAELMEHGHVPPFDFIIGPSDEATVKGLPDFIPVASMNVRYGDSVSLATIASNIDAGGNYAIGTIEDFIVKVVRGMPQYYGVAYKSYGPRSQRNPLAIRVPKGASSVRFEVMPDPNGGKGIVPLQNLMLFAEFGVGVKDRTAATPRYVNNETWADGTAA